MKSCKGVRWYKTYIMYEVKNKRNAITYIIKYRCK